MRTIFWGLAGFALFLLYWLFASSLLFLYLLDLWSAYPWPSRLWMWILYALNPPPPVALVNKWLTITGAVTFMAPLVIGGVIVWGRRQAEAPLYGATEWPTRRAIRRSGFSLRRKL